MIFRDVNREIISGWFEEFKDDLEVGNVDSSISFEAYMDLRFENYLEDPELDDIMYS